MPLSAFISTECIKFGRMSVDSTGASGLRATYALQQMHADLCLWDLGTEEAPYVIWLVQDHKHDFDVTRLASVLEKGAKIVQRHSIKVCRTFTQSISQKHFSENTITLYLRKIFWLALGAWKQETMEVFLIKVTWCTNFVK